MRFLVTGENVEPGYEVPMEQVAATVERALVPSFEILARMEQEGRIRGGLYAGERGGAFVIDAESPTELTAIINHLPFTGLVRWQVKALYDFADGAEQAREFVQQVRAMNQPGQ